MSYIYEHRLSSIYLTATIYDTVVRVDSSTVPGPKLFDS